MKIHGNISPVTDTEFSVNEETSENSDSSHSPNSLKSMQPISPPCSSEPDSPRQELPTVSSTASPTLPIHPTPTLPQPSMSQLNEWYVCQNTAVSHQTNEQFQPMNNFGHLAMHSQPLLQFS